MRTIHCNSEGLYDLPGMMARVWPDPASRPSKRYVRNLQAQRRIPYRRIGRLVFFSPEEVRSALDRRFTIHPE